MLGYGGVDDPARLRRLFDRVGAALPIGGLFLFDLLMPSSGEPMRYRHWEAGDDWAVLIQVEEQPHRRRLVRDIITFRRAEDGYRRGRERHQLRLAPVAEVEDALREAGFAPRHERRIGSVEPAPQRLAFVARRVAPVAC